MAENERSEKRVPCKWCGQMTTATGLRECAGCWELRSRIDSQPDLAKRMLGMHDWGKEGDE